MSNKILVTGFTGFLGESLNPSQEILKKIKNEYPQSADTLLLPVSFQQSWVLLKAQLQQQNYNYILMLGQAGGRKTINLERVALNWIETDHADEDGVKPPTGVAVEGAPEVLFSKLPVAELSHLLKQEDLDSEVSLSAGGYVCNFLYFNCLNFLREQKRNESACFIHIPYMPEQLAGKSSTTPSMSLETSARAIETLIGFLIK